MHQTWDATQFAAALQAVVDAAGLKQAEVAQRAGRSRTQVNRWINGHHRPDYDAMSQLAASIQRDFPALTRETAAMMHAAGYGAPDARDPRPAVVRQHWTDPDVQKLWSLSVTEDQRLSLIEDVLAKKRGADSEADDGSA